MHTLSLFPELLTFGFFAPTILRLAAGLYLLKIGKERLKMPMQWTAIISLVSGIAIILGLYTQIAAIIGILFIKYDLWERGLLNQLMSEHAWLRIIVTVILLSLLVTGPGFLAFDLPL